jgi:molecular chaperone DnaJ
MFKKVSEAYEVAEGPGQARRLRPLRARRVPGPGRPGPGGMAGPGASTIPSTSSARSSARAAAAGASSRRCSAAAAAATGAGTGPTCATTWRSRSRRRRAASRRRSPSASWSACERCHGTGAEPGSKRVTCPTCRGAGQVRRSGGIIVFTQTCPTCGGTGVKIEKPCTACRGEGRVAQDDQAQRAHPAGVDTGSRLRSAGNGEAGSAGGDGRRPLHRPHRQGARALRAPGRRPFLRDPDQVHPGDARRLDRGAHALGQGEPQDPGRHPERHDLPAARQGHARLRGGRHGDQLVRVHVEVPTSLTAEQRKLLEEFARVSGDAQEPTSRSFFEKAKKFF